MELPWIVPALAAMTLLVVLFYALRSKQAVERRRHDPNAPKSTLAKDGPQGGVAMLDPAVARRRQDNPRERPPARRFPD